MGIETLINAIKHWVKKIFVTKKDLRASFSKDSALNLANEFGLIETVSDNNGNVYTDKSGKIIII